MRIVQYDSRACAVCCHCRGTERLGDCGLWISAETRVALKEHNPAITADFVHDPANDRRFPRSGNAREYRQRSAIFDGLHEAFNCTLMAFASEITCGGRFTNGL